MEEGLRLIKHVVARKEHALLRNQDARLSHRVARMMDQLDGVPPGVQRQPVGKGDGRRVGLSFRDEGISLRVDDGHTAQNISFGDGQDSFPGFLLPDHRDLEKTVAREVIPVAFRVDQVLRLPLGRDFPCPFTGDRGALRRVDQNDPAAGEDVAHVAAPDFGFHKYVLC